MDLNEYMEKNNVLQKDMANELGITVSHLWMLIRDKASPSRKLAIRIEKATKGEVTKEEAIFGKHAN